MNHRSDSTEADPPVARAPQAAGGCRPALAMEATGLDGLTGRLETTRARVLTAASQLLYSYSTLLFIRSRLVGAAVLLSTFLDFNLGASGLLSYAATILFARLIGIRKSDPVHSVYTYNALIVGFSIGYLFKISFPALLLTASASCLTVLVSGTLFSMLSKRLNLPVLNLPFLLVSTIIYLASLRYASLFAYSYHVSGNLNLSFVPDWLQGLLRSFGMIVFMPYDLCGVVILTALLIVSRIAFFLGVASYTLGTFCLALLGGSFASALLNPSTFNFALTGMALGGVFLVASRRSYLYALVGVFVSVFVLDASTVVCSTLGIPVFTLPFNLVVLLFLHVLMQSGYPEVTRSLKATPEATLSNHLNFVERFDPIIPKPFLPFSGKWKVYQGFDDVWTHQGIWKYAYDFVIEDEMGRTHRGAGRVPEDYYCFGKPVLSPIGGTVVEAADDLADNPIGEVDKAISWGNYIIIYCPAGYYVEISHLRRQSLKVKAGDPVKVGEILAACGNSGFSPQPHIHMQVQYQPLLGSETTTFTFANCLDGDGHLVENRPLESGAIVQAFSFSRDLSKVLSFILDDSFEYRLTRNGEEAESFRLTVRMAPDGSCCLCIDGTEDRLYFGLQSSRFVFYSFEGRRGSPLEMFFAALPKVPLCSRIAVSWTEVLPDNMLFNRSPLRSFLKPFDHSIGRVEGSYRFSDEYEVEGKISSAKQSVQTKVVFDDNKGFKEVHAEVSGVRWSAVRVDE